MEAFCADLKSNLFGNPHSASPSSDLSTQRVNRVRAAVLEYFNADPEYFDIVFVANATAAIKLVMHSFQEQGFWYGYHKDAHTSVVGVREVAKSARCFTSNREVEEWIGSSEPSTAYARAEETGLALFAYPAQSNMTGHRLPNSWPQRIRSSHRNCYVLLDAASYLTTGRLDLGNHRLAPDFISLSFYKIFGFPDLGALIVRKDAIEILKSRRYFGGGTVDMIIDLDASWHAMKNESVHDVLEDGTLPFHNIVALEHALAVQKQLFGSASQISQHVSYLSSWLYRELSGLQHHNGKPVVQVHKEDHSTHGDPSSQGPIIAFSILDSDGEYMGKSQIETLAIVCGIQLRTGGVCNPGGIASMLQLQSWELRRNFSEGVRCGNEIDVLGGKPTGIIRVSLGAMTTMIDVQVFAYFVRFFFVEGPQRGPSRPVLNGFDSAIDITYDSHSGSPYQTILPDCQPIDNFYHITPVKGCQPFILPQVPGKSAKEVHRAYAPWHQQWQLVDPRTGEPLIRPTAELYVSIVPHAGNMRLSTKRSGGSTSYVKFPPHDSKFTNDAESPLSSRYSTETATSDLIIDLWTLPSASGDKATANVSPSIRHWDIYTDARVVEWLTQTFGTPCTLARYRRNQVDQGRSTCCVVRRCRVQCWDLNGVKAHYESHRMEFEEVLRINHIDRGTPVVMTPNNNNNTTAPTGTTVVHTFPPPTHNTTTVQSTPSSNVTFHRRPVMSPTPDNLQSQPSTLLQQQQQNPKATRSQLSLVEPVKTKVSGGFRTMFIRRRRVM